MISRYLILFATGLVGALSLLALQIFTRRRRLQEILTATWLMLLVALWLVLPSEGRWLFSLWRPSAILGGQLIMGMSPDIWALGLALGLTFAGVAWVQVADGHAALPLSGVVTMGSLLTIWLALTSGTLLTVLAAWTLFDLLWGAAGLIAMNDGERVTFGWLLNGLASVILWIVILLVEREGGSTLWWLMVPSAPVKSLLFGAAMLRIGLYPFHISFPQRAGDIDPLFLISSMNPVLGLGLLYRVLSLSNVQALPGWMMAFGVATLLWGGIQAWRSRPADVPVRVSYALLGVILIGAATADRVPLLLHGTATWFASWSLLWLSRPRSRGNVAWSWSGQIALLFLLGSPPSTLGTLYRTAFAEQGWIVRATLLLSLVLMGVALVRFGRRRTDASISPPWVWQKLTLALGLALPWVASFCCTQLEPASLLGMVLWAVGVLAAIGIVRWQKGRSVTGQRLEPLWSFMDLQWVHRSLWRGAEHVLSGIRVVAEVVEGSGAMLWSVLVILIVLLIRSS
jgi:hypothetical protein